MGAIKRTVTFRNVVGLPPCLSPDRASNNNYCSRRSLKVMMVNCDRATVLRLAAKARQATEGA
jgi:hypothetical protein